MLTVPFSVLTPVSAGSVAPERARATCCSSVATACSEATPVLRPSSESSRPPLE